MGMFSTGYKGKIVVDAAVLPTGVSDVATSSLFDGALGGLTGLLDGGTTFHTGIAKTAGEATKILLAVSGTSKYTTGSFIPRKSV